jgi:hypothetical protein
MSCIAVDGALAEPTTATPMPGQMALLLGAFDLAILDYRADDFFVPLKHSRTSSQPRDLATRWRPVWGST